jgi:threonine 3-dehydrogenase
MGTGDGMLALVYDKARDDWDTTKGFRKVEVPRPVLAQESDPEDAASAIVKVIYSGVCGSDRGIWFRQSFKGMIFESLRAEKKTWRVIGHEMVGEIVAVGSYARSHYGFREKDIVAAESHIICGRCYQCRLGETHVCDDDRIIGISRDGCFAEYIKLPARVLWPTDDKKISLKVAAVQEPFGNAVHACTKVDMRGRTVAVFGCGPIGLFTILNARVLGASRVFGIEPDAQKREMAMTLGADDVFAPAPAPATPAGATGAAASWSADRDVVKSLRAATGGIGVDVSVEMAGYNSSVNSAIHSVRRGGDVVLFGLKSGDFTIEAFDRLIVNGVTLHSVIGRQIFRTWYVTRGLLEDRSNGIQQKIYDVILRGATDTIVEADSFDPAAFEAKLIEYPKLLLKF